MNLSPRDLQKKLTALEQAYGVTQKELEALILAFGFDDIDRLLADVNTSIDTLDARTSVLVRETVHRIVVFETRRAERLIGTHRLEIPTQVMDAIDRRFYVALHQQNEEIRKNVTEAINRGYKRGMSVADKRAFQKAVIDEGITGIVRADGSRLSVEATGKLLVRSRVVQLQAETQLHRYREAKLTHVEFSASAGECNFTPSCNEFDGKVYPIDDIPVSIPLHHFCRCRWLPVVPH